MILLRSLRISGRRGCATLTKLVEDNKVLKNEVQALEERLSGLAGMKQELEDRVNTVTMAQQLQDDIEFTASKDITPLNLADLVDYCKQDEYKTHLFLYRELPIRTAIAIEQLSAMPHGYTTMPSTRLVREWLVEEFKALTALPKPDTPETEAQFTKTLRQLHKKYQESIVTLGKGLWELKKDMLRNKAKIRDGKVAWSRVTELVMTMYPGLQHELDTFYAGRISAGFLIRQHNAIAAAKKRGPRKGAEDYIGLVCRRTDLTQVCEDAIQDARDICVEGYNTCPEIVLKRQFDKDNVKIPHIPAHLHYILFELLKNSLRATIEAHPKGKGPVPPVEVVVCDGKNLEDVSVRISDQGGGIPRSSMSKVMSYMYTTAQVSQFDLLVAGQQESSTPLAGFGYGLPISRLYARHFDGDLRLLSVEGYGTDAYLHLGRSLQSTFETQLRTQRRLETQRRQREHAIENDWKAKPSGSQISSLDVPSDWRW